MVFIKVKNKCRSCIVDETDTVQTILDKYQLLEAEYVITYDDNEIFPSTDLSSLDTCETKRIYFSRFKVYWIAEDSIKAANKQVKVTTANRFDSVAKFVGTLGYRDLNITIIKHGNENVDPTDSLEDLNVSETNPIRISRFKVYWIAEDSTKAANKQQQPIDLIA